MKRHNTHILAVSSDSARIATIGMQEGFMPFRPDTQSLPFEINDVWLGPRDVLETNVNFKQVIPYVLVRRDGRLLTYRRTQTGGESRLHGNSSIGFGGHVDANDIALKEAEAAIDLEATVGNAIQRELEEELSISLLSFEAVGILLDESNDVGRVHVGIVMLADVTGMCVSKEDQIELTGFKTLGELEAEMHEGEFESWSNIIIKALPALGIIA